MLQVVLRARMSISPDWRAGKRSLAESGVYFTLVASPKTAAATALHRSTSRPDQLPAESCAPKPARFEPFTPHWTKPLAFTSESVSACAAVAPSPSTAAPTSAVTIFFAIFSQPFSVVFVLSAGPASLTGAPAELATLPVRGCLSHAQNDAGS